jgi:hypothetical protein
MQRGILLIWESPGFGSKAMRTSLLIALSGLLAIGAEAQAQVARQEIYALQSVTLSDSDFLSGKIEGVPVTLAGALRLPKLGTEKLPAVILLHGSGGIGGSGGMIDEWSRELNEIGVATFAVDSFAGRGIVETVTDQTRLGRLNMIIDAYRALDLLSRHRQLDDSHRGNGVLTRRSIFHLFEPDTLPKNAWFRRAGVRCAYWFVYTVRHYLSRR